MTERRSYCTVNAALLYPGLARRGLIDQWVAKVPADKRKQVQQLAERLLNTCTHLQPRCRVPLTRLSVRQSQDELTDIVNSCTTLQQYTLKFIIYLVPCYFWVPLSRQLLVE